MAKVDFKRVETDAEVEEIDFKDGQLIFSKSGKAFMDYDEDRIPVGGGPVDTAMSDSSENAVQNKVIKGYVDDEITGAKTYADGKVVNTSGTATNKAYSQSFINDLNTCSQTEHIVGTWYDGRPIYSKWIYKEIPAGSTTFYENILNNTSVEYVWVNSYFMRRTNSSIPPYTFLGNGSSNGSIYLWIDNTYDNSTLGGTVSSSSYAQLLYVEIRYIKPNN